MMNGVFIQQRRLVGNNPVNSYTLANQAKVSAGIYTIDGKLIRTLFSGEEQTQGTYPTPEWDGTDDNGGMVISGNYQVKVLENNVEYEWLGVVGNTSDNNTGSSVMHSYEWFHDIILCGDYMYCSIGSNETRPSIWKMHKDTPNQKIWVLNNPTGNSTGEFTHHLCTDGSIVYCAGADEWVEDTRWFVYAIDSSNDSLFTFTGTEDISYPLTFGRVYPSVIDYQEGDEAIISGMAVQGTGNYLFISHKDQDRIRVFHKLTGDFVRDISMTHPKKIVVVDNDWLWVTSEDNVIEKYEINGDGTITSDSVIISDVSNPIAISVSPDNTIISILDADTNQHKRYNHSDGASSASPFGQSVGYSLNENIENDKFYLSDNVQTYYSFLFYESDGSYWMGDPGNKRVVHFSNEDVFIEYVMFFDAIYNINIDNDDDTRLFAGTIEFSISYPDPTENWTAIKNWGYNLPLEGRNQVNGYFRKVFTINNKTFTEVFNSNNDKVLAELEDGNGLQLKNTIVDGNLVYSDMSRRFYRTESGNRVFEKQQYLGFDENQLPSWGIKSIYMSIPENQQHPLDGGWQTRSGQETSSGILITFKGNYSIGNTKYHLGAIKDNEWVFMTAKEIPEGLPFPNFPLGNEFDNRGGIVLPDESRLTGGSVMVKDDHIIWTYPSEFYRGDQVNKYNHMSHNGLFIGQFGKIGAEVGESAEGMAGNAFFPHLKKIGNDLYLFGNDEWDHGGIHVWKITNLYSIYEHTIPITI